MASTSDAGGSTRWRGFLAAGVVAALLSSAVCALVYAVARAVGVSPLLPALPPDTGTRPLPLPLVLLSCVGLALLATLLFALLARLTRRPLEVLLGLGLLLTLAALVPPFLLEADTSTRVVLGLLPVLALLFTLGPLVGMVEPPSRA